MSKYNATRSRGHEDQEIDNLAGGRGYKESPELELVSLMATSFMQDKFYQSTDETMIQLRSLLGKVDPIFAAQAAIFVRDQFNMRSVTHVVASELSKIARGEKWLSRFYDSVIVRPDDMTEIAAYMQKNLDMKRANGRIGLPSSFRKGAGRAFNRFNRYQIGKYRGDGKNVSLVDILRLAHVKPSDDEHAQIFKDLYDGTLKAEDTWEMTLTQAGQAEGDKESLKANAWREMVNSGKIGYMALVRNLRNIMASAPDTESRVVELLTDENRIKKSRMLPFRFLTAINELSNGEIPPRVVAALSDATEISLGNVPSFDGTTLVVLDESSSMGGSVNARSPWNIGSLFAAVLVKKNAADYMGFATDASYHTVNPRDSILGIQKEMNRQRVSGGTNLTAAFLMANKKYDRIIVLSDMQSWQDGDSYYGGYGYRNSSRVVTPNDALKMYSKAHNANPYVYSFDLSGYGQLSFPQDKVFALAGFSDKTMELMAMLERDKSVMVNAVKAVRF